MFFKTEAPLSAGKQIVLKLFFRILVFPVFSSEVFANGATNQILKIKHQVKD